MRRWQVTLFNNWQIKLVSLVAATLIWLFIYHTIVHPPPPSSAVAPSLPSGD